MKRCVQYRTVMIHIIAIVITRQDNVQHYTNHPLLYMPCHQLRQYHLGAAGPRGVLARKPVGMAVPDTAVAL